MIYPHHTKVRIVNLNSFSFFHVCIRIFADYCSGRYGFSISRHTAFRVRNRPYFWVFYYHCFFPSERHFHSGLTICTSCFLGQYFQLNLYIGSWFQIVVYHISWSSLILTIISWWKIVFFRSIFIYCSKGNSIFFTLLHFFFSFYKTRQILSLQKVQLAIQKNCQLSIDKSDKCI